MRWIVVVEPDIKKFLDAQAGYEVGFEVRRLETLVGNVVVAFKQHDLPTHRTFSQQFAAAGRRTSETDA